jgi:hypothetical protein
MNRLHRGGEIKLNRRRVGKYDNTKDGFANRSALYLMPSLLELAWIRDDEGLGNPGA